MRTRGYLTDIFYLLHAGRMVYIVSAPAETHALPLDGAWVDDDGNLHIDCAAVVFSHTTAREISRAFRQQCFLHIAPCANGLHKVYLLKDTPLLRQVALKWAGGYTADGEHILVAVDADNSKFFTDYIGCITANIDFVPVQ
jgi:hypothetical protein